MDSRTTYIVGLIWMFTYILYVHIDMPSSDEIKPQLESKYDARKQFKSACRDYLERVD